LVKRTLPKARKKPVQWGLKGGVGEGSPPARPSTGLEPLEYYHTTPSTAASLAASVFNTRNIPNQPQWVQPNFDSPAAEARGDPPRSATYVGSVFNPPPIDVSSPAARSSSGLNQQQRATTLIAALQALGQQVESATGVAPNAPDFNTLLAGFGLPPMVQAQAADPSLGLQRPMQLRQSFQVSSVLPPGPLSGDAAATTTYTTTDTAAAGRTTTGTGTASPATVLQGVPVNELGANTDGGNFPAAVAGLARAEQVEEQAARIRAEFQKKEDAKKEEARKKRASKKVSNPPPPHCTPLCSVCSAGGSLVDWMQTRRCDYNNPIALAALWTLEGHAAV